MEYGTADELARAGSQGVYGLVVVALEYECSRVPADNAVKGDLVFAGKVVGSNVAYRIRQRPGNDDQVPLVVDRVHADAMGDDDRYLPAHQGNPGDGDQS